MVSVLRLGYVLVDVLHLDHAELDVFTAKLQVSDVLQRSLVFSFCGPYSLTPTLHRVPQEKFTLVDGETLHPPSTPPFIRSWSKPDVIFILVPMCGVLQVLNLLLDMPGGFAEVLLEHGCLPRVVQLVELQLVRQAFQDG